MDLLVRQPFWGSAGALPCGSSRWIKHAVLLAAAVDLSAHRVRAAPCSSQHAGMIQIFRPTVVHRMAVVENALAFVIHVLRRALHKGLLVVVILIRNPARVLPLDPEH